MSPQSLRYLALIGAMAPRFADCTRRGNEQEGEYMTPARQRIAQQVDELLEQHSFERDEDHAHSRKSRAPGTETALHFIPGNACPTPCGKDDPNHYPDYLIAAAQGRPMRRRRQNAGATNAFPWRIQGDGQELQG